LWIEEQIYLLLLYLFIYLIYLFMYLFIYLFISCWLFIRCSIIFHFAHIPAFVGSSEIYIHANLWFLPYARWRSQSELHYVWQLSIVWRDQN
jgi:hypothetical protein